MEERERENELSLSLSSSWSSSSNAYWGAEALFSDSVCVRLDFEPEPCRLMAMGTGIVERVLVAEGRRAYERPAGRVACSKDSVSAPGSCIRSRTSRSRSESESSSSSVSAGADGVDILEDAEEEESEECLRV